MNSKQLREQFEKENEQYRISDPILDNYTTDYSNWLEQKLIKAYKELESYKYMLEKYIGED